MTQFISVGINGIKPVRAYAVTSKSQELYFCVTHGEDGRGRWQLRYPIPSRVAKPAITGESLEVAPGKIVPINKQDSRGNEQYLIVPGEVDNEIKFVVFWYLSPGYRGGADYAVEGNAEIIGIGEEAQGAPGRMGGAVTPVVKVTGPCELHWQRSGRLYGGAANLVAIYDGEKWVVNAKDLCALEDAVFNY